MSAQGFIENRIPFQGFETWYRITGDLDSPLTPLVVVHGGPGCTHDYLLNLTDLANDGRAIIHYDQLGSGRSTHLPDRGGDFWTVDLFIAELHNLLDHLEIHDSFYLLGQSWGGMLGAEFAMRQPHGLEGLILSNSPASMALWSSAAKKLRLELAPEVAEALDRHEAQGTTLDPEYIAATQVYYDEHVCRVLPNPPELVKTMEFMAQDSTVYHTMNGPNEFHCIGTLKDWSVVGKLDAIKVPTLLLSGRHDEATPETVQPFFDEIQDAKWVIFEESSHMPFVEERGHFMAVVNEFLEELDQGH
jgi:L-proline amide hydrolase